jgi:hypothetical protein
MVAMTKCSIFRLDETFCMDVAMSRLGLALIAVVMAGPIGSAGAGDFLSRRSTDVIPVQYLDCDRCGCLGVSYARHRELRSTYGLRVDPRNFDQTEPHYRFGRMRTYARYWPMCGS